MRSNSSDQSGKNGGEKKKRRKRKTRSTRRREYLSTQKSIRREERSIYADFLEWILNLLRLF